MSYSFGHFRGSEAPGLMDGRWLDGQWARLNAVGINDEDDVLVIIILLSDARWSCQVESRYSLLRV